MTTDQEVGDSSSSGRAADALALQGHRRVNIATVEDMTPDFWVASWSVAIGLAFVIAVRAAVTTEVTC